MRSFRLRYQFKTNLESGQVESVDYVRMVRIADDGSLKGDVAAPDSEPLILAIVRLKCGEEPKRVMDFADLKIGHSYCYIKQTLEKRQHILTDGRGYWVWVALDYWRVDTATGAHTAILKVASDPPDSLRRMNQHDRKLIESFAAHNL